MLQIRGGQPVDESAYYDALGELLNAVGKELAPKVVANAQLADIGHGRPDFGLYTAGQLKKISREKPERGVVEVKGLAADLKTFIRSEQAGKYLDGYGLVLAVNYRGFALAERDARGNPVVLESCEIAESESAFWNGLSRIPQARGPALCEFLRRAMTRAAPLSKAKDVADLLASYAREAADILKSGDDSALAPLRAALESSLGVKFKGDDFFRSTLVQTVFYGLFSAWMESDDDGKFDWKSAAFAVKTPVIRTLFAEIVTPVRIGDLGVRHLLDSAAAGLNRVADKKKLFGAGAFDAIQYFYEPFLAAFDPVLRKELGVWYTPPEIVRYMARRVDEVLKKELKIPEGLAADNVRVLDPCCGSGAYVAEILRVIRGALEKRDGELAAAGLKRAALERVFGFEIMPAPFVLAHWQIGALLGEAGANLENGERAAVYLTNALTGWGDAQKAQIPIAFRELAEERDHAGRVKQKEPIWVVIGNPPYNAFAGTSPDEEDGLAARYKQGLREKWKIKKYNLDDLYVRFFRAAERRIVKSGRGVVCFISNHSYVTEPSFVVMRESLLENFDRVWIDNLNGAVKRGGTPDGKIDKGVFPIGVGTAIGLFARKPRRDKAPVVRHRDFWGEDKARRLLNPAECPAYETAAARARDRHSFRPLNIGDEYRRWPGLEDVVAHVCNGMQEMRQCALIDFDRKTLEKRMRAYFDARIDWAACAAKTGGLARDAARFDAEKTRKQMLEAGMDSGEFIRYGMRPFDDRWAYHTLVRPLWNDPRPTLRGHARRGNRFLMSRKRAVTHDEGVPMFFAECVGDYHFLRGDTKYIPFRLWRDEMGQEKSAPNLSCAARKYLSALGFKPDDSAAELLLLHALAMGYSPLYRDENADGLRIDWPRIPPPGSGALLRKSAQLGRRVSSLLDSRAPVSGVDAGDIPSRLRVVAGIKRTGGGKLNLSINAGWGTRNDEGVARPRNGRAEFRAWTAAEKAALPARHRKMLGRAVDVYLNNGAFWSGVPEAAWNFRIGGYPVARKWLSYREASMTGRPLREDEARHFTAMIRRLSELVLLTDNLDANYRAAKDSAGEWEIRPSSI